ncbi:MAG: hypothetical protein BWY25_02969 [Chloroflexi bacterium ADurb.Bin222]|nr:MAG: hypothetical protein BWY25_02969 [Chloroflexi bacterium ADurb.Bin222]
MGRVRAIARADHPRHPAPGEVQPRHEEEQKTAHVVDDFGSALRNDEGALIALRRRVPGEETANAAGDDREKSGEHAPQDARGHALEERQRRHIQRAGNVLRRQLDPREEVLQHPWHRKQPHERRQQVLIRDLHRHQRAIHQDEAQQPGEQESRQPGSEGTPRIPPPSPACRRPVSALGPFGKQHVGDDRPQNPAHVRAQHLTDDGQEARGHRRERDQEKQTPQPAQSTQRHRLVAALLQQVLLSRQDDEDSAVIGDGEENAGDGVEHRVAGDQAQEKERHALRRERRLQGRAKKQQESRHVVDVQRRHQRQYRGRDSPHQSPRHEIEEGRVHVTAPVANRGESAGGALIRRGRRRPRPPLRPACPPPADAAARPPRSTRARR